jgi:pyrroline-5-carboxylate reductase
MKISFIGGGNMAVALIGGLRKQGFSAAAIQVVEPMEQSRERLDASFGIRCIPEIDAAALHCDVLVLAVKPQVMREALAPLAGKLTQQLVISIAAGLRLADLSRWLGGHRKLVRTMPNTPALIASGITGMFADASVDNEARNAAERILKAVGATVWLTDEAQIDAVTAISGSGPAYVFYFLEAMEAAAVELGFDAAAARQLSVETFVGASRLAQQSKESISTLRAQVTSKGGTTEAALKVFAEQAIAQSIGQGIRAAQARGQELGDLLGKD